MFIEYSLLLLYFLLSKQYKIIMYKCTAVPPYKDRVSLPCGWHYLQYIFYSVTPLINSVIEIKNSQKGSLSRFKVTFSPEQ